MPKSPPEKPKGDRKRLSLTAHNITLETPIGREMELFDTDLEEGEIPADTFTEIIQNESDEVILKIWNQWLSVLFDHRHVPVRLFNTKKVDIQGVEGHLVRTDTHGRSERPVLRRNRRFENHLQDTALAVCLEHAIKSDRPPHEVVKDIPFQLFPSEIYRVREFVENNGGNVWITFDNRNWWERGPLSLDFPMRGIVYFMYTLADDGIIVPRYIGISRQHGFTEGELNWNFANSRSDSIYLRWGYGKGQHLGELSAAIWPDKYTWKPKPKYQRWRDGLFVGDTRLLKRPVYIEMLPWMNDNLLWSEENLIRAASVLFRNELLNTEFTADHAAREQMTFGDSSVRRYTL